MGIRTLKPDEITDEIRKLYERAKKARRYAHAPYSGFKVGAAVQAENGEIFTGCNVENQSFGLSCCAERNAINKMVRKGERKIRRICVVLKGGAEAGGSSCGMCRQAIWEFAAENLNLEIVLADPKSNMRVTTIGYLLPDAFQFKF